MPDDACIECGARGNEHDNGCSGNDVGDSSVAQVLALPMTADQRAKFRRNVIELLKAGWHTGKIADWAISAASGFGRFWNSREHALQECNRLCREINNVRRLAARNVRMIFRANGL